MGPASLKTSPPLGAPLVRKKAQTLENKGEATFAYSSAKATPLHLYVKPK
jgi:hypothetical protein